MVVDDTKKRVKKYLPGNEDDEEYDGRAIGGRIDRNLVGTILRRTFRKILYQIISEGLPGGGGSLLPCPHCQNIPCSLIALFPRNPWDTFVSGIDPH